MGAAACKHCNKAEDGIPAVTDEAVPVMDDAISFPKSAAPEMASPAAAEGAGVKQGQEYIIMLEKTEGVKLGLDVDTMAEEGVLPIRAITGGLVENWNNSHPDTQVLNGDKIIEVNGVRGDAASLVEKCAREQTLRMVLKRA